MKLPKRILRFFYDSLFESTAAALRKKHIQGNKSIAWSECAELTELYAAMKPAFSQPDFSDIDNIISQDPLKQTDVDLKLSAVGVIVETRKNERLEFVISNFIQQTGLSVQLFHGTKNLPYILAGKLHGYVKSGQVMLHELGTDELDGAKYNALFLSESFWDAMIGRGKIFVFQADSCICPNSVFSLQDFLRFDYIGSRWSRKRPNGLIIDGGVGGLSIRDWKKSVECLDAFPPRLWKGGEDGYFAFHIELLGGQVGKVQDCGRFSTQEVFSHKSYGAHKISCLPRGQRQKFIGYCPDAAFLLK